MRAFAKNQYAIKSKTVLKIFISRAFLLWGALFFCIRGSVLGVWPLIAGRQINDTSSGME